MSKLFATLLGAAIGAVALTASAQTTPAATTTPAQVTAPAATTSTVKKSVKAKHHKHKKVVKANPAK